MRCRHVNISYPIRGRSIPLYVSTTETSKLGSDIVLQFEIVEDEFNYQIVRGLQKDGRFQEYKAQRIKENM